jgi:hypothetical protein
MKKTRHGTYHGKNRERGEASSKMNMGLKKIIFSHALYVDNKFILPILPTPKKNSCFCPNDPFILSTTYQVAQE